MLWKLIKLRLLGMFSRTVSRGNKKGKSGSAGKMLLFGFLLLYVAIAFGFLFFSLFTRIAVTVCDKSEYQWFFFALIGLFSFGISFFFTAFTARSELFEAKDNELLLSMPIPPRTILLSRMAILIGAEYLFSVLVMVPAALAWFAETGANGAVLLRYIIGCLFLPLLSASLATLLGWLLARLTARARNKSIVNTVLSLIFLALYFLVYTNAEKYITSMLERVDTVSKSVEAWGFLFAWLGRGIAYGELGKLLGVVGISVFAFALAVILISRGFLRITSTSSRAGKARKGGVQLQSGSISSALLKKELRRFFSSSVYIMNCGLGIIFSVAAAVYLLIKGGSLSAVITPLMQAGLFSETELALAGGILLSVLTWTHTITAPSVSMEGKNLWIVRSAPIPAKKILTAKLLLQEVLCAPAALLLSVAAAIVLKPGAVGWVLIILIPQLFLLHASAFGLMINLLLPKLDWTNEAVPVKQSASVLIAIFSLMGYMLLAGIGFFLLVIEHGVPMLPYLLAVIGVTLIWCALTLLWLYRRGSARFDKL